MRVAGPARELSHRERDTRTQAPRAVTPASRLNESPGDPVRFRAGALEPEHSMKKKTQKPLSLHRDVLRNLVPDELHQVAGGVRSDLCTLFCPTGTCPPPTHTTSCPQ
jgi:hypothetical protein